MKSQKPPGPTDNNAKVHCTDGRTDADDLCDLYIRLLNNQGREARRPHRVPSDMTRLQRNQKTTDGSVRN